MKSALKPSFLLLISLFLVGCDPAPPVIVDLGEIPPSVKQRVPYEDGGVYRFRHSQGAVIAFKAVREARKTQTKCIEFCDKIYEYEEDITLLQPDYLLFSPVLRITNQDTVSYTFEIDLPGGFCVVPTSLKWHDRVGFSDSLVLGETTYYDVFLLESYQYGGFYEDSIRIDSLYYNYKSGILKILMTDGAYFERYD